MYYKRRNWQGKRNGKSMGDAIGISREFGVPLSVGMASQHPIECRRANRIYSPIRR